MPSDSVLTAAKRFARILAVIAAVLAVAPLPLLALYTVVSPLTPLMLWRAVQGEAVVRMPVSLAAIDRDVIVSVIASEDNGFCGHAGVDWGELREVIDDEDGPQRGASTITMQVAKNLFLWNGRSYIRKALEIPLALLVDLVWSKSRILETYLNIAEWGPDGEFGIEAGARRALHKSAARLTAHEAALLVVMLPNPHRRDAGRPSRGLRRVAGIIERRAARSPELADCIGGG